MWNSKKSALANWSIYSTNCLENSLPAACIVGMLQKIRVFLAYRILLQKKRACYRWWLATWIYAKSRRLVNLAVDTNFRNTWSVWCTCAPFFCTTKHTHWPTYVHPYPGTHTPAQHTHTYNTTPTPTHSTPHPHTHPHTTHTHTQITHSWPTVFFQRRPSPCLHQRSTQNIFQICAHKLVANASHTHMYAYVYKMSLKVVGQCAEKVLRIFLRAHYLYESTQ